MPPPDAPPDAPPESPPDSPPPPGPRSGHASRVADPRLEQALREWLQDRMPRADVPDAVQNVLEALLSYSTPPETLDGLIALGCRILRNDLTDYYRHREVVRGVVTGPLDDTHNETIGPPVPVDAFDRFDLGKRARLVDHFVARGKLTKDDVEVLERAEEEGLPALAAEFGTTAQALRVRVHRKRTLLKEGWARYVAFGLSGLAVLLIALYGLLRRKEQIAHDDIKPEPTYAPTAPERAATLRLRARDECEDAQWKKCVDDLDGARDLDPAGDSAPAIQDLRQQANDALAPAPTHTSDKPPVRVHDKPPL
jgi:DNA-directed RNA polymerase specialized sigma24 family protein